MPVFFVNRDGMLQEETTKSGAAPAGNARSVAYLDSDADGHDDYEAFVDATPLSSPGPSVVSAHVVGPETIDSAGPFGLNAFLLFDRVVDPARAAIASTYTIPNNAVVAAQAVLSGRFVALSLAQPEGPNVPTTIAVAGLPDSRGVVAGIRYHVNSQG